MTRAEHTAVPDRRPRLMRTRRAAIRVVYTPPALLAIVMSQGVVGQLTGSYTEGNYGFAAASTTPWKVLSLWGALGIVWTAGRSVVCVQWYLAGQLTWSLVSGLAPQEPDKQSGTQAALQMLVSAVVVVIPWLILAPERRELLRLRVQPDRVALATLAVAAPLLAWWTSENRALVIPDLSGHKGSGLELRFDVVGIAVVFLTIGLLAALRPGGTRWLLGVVGLGAVLVGVAAVICDAGDVAAPGRIGGVAFLAGGGLLVSRSGLPRRVPTGGLADRAADPAGAVA